MVKLSKPPVDKLENFLLRVDDDVLGLDISMHYSFGVTEVQGFQQLKQVEPNFIICHAGNQGAEISIF